MSKVIVLSDTHGMHDKLNLGEGDILIHCGDFSAHGTFKDHISFAKWMGEQKFTHKLCTPGNHDTYSESNTNHAKEMFKEYGVHLLIDEEISIDGKRIYMSPFTPRYGRWSFMKERGDEMAVKWKNIPEGLDILVTHGPPHGILDYSIYDHVHAGCEELLREVYTKKPQHHCFGHIHHYGGTSNLIDNIMFHNSAVCDEGYSLTNDIVEFIL